jgi:hypothetical protein
MRVMSAPLFLLLAAAAAVPSRPATTASTTVSPAAALFDRDWVLMNWALKFYDSDLDILLSPGEAKVAADAFRRIADGDGDGRITPQEYRAAREFILARY